MKLLKTLAAMTALVVGASAFAIDGTEIMQNVYDRQKPDFTQAAVQLTLTKDGKVEDVRTVGEYGRCKNNLTDIVMDFKTPATVAGTRFLVKENQGREDDKYIYLPSLKQDARRINTSEGDKPFVGTDFSYNDMSSREVDEDTHKLLKESEDKGNFKDLYVVESIPKDPKSSQYSKRISWVTKDSWIPTYIELYDKKGNLLKVNEIKSITKMSGNGGHVYNIPTENVMTNVQKKHASIMKLGNLKIDQPIPNRVFSKEFLKTGK